MIARGSLAERLAGVERDLESGCYKPGAWQALLRELRRLPGPERLALADDISRVSDKLHRRTSRHTFGVAAGFLAEVAAAVAGGALLWLAVRSHSNAAAMAAALLWTMAFQPLVKVMTGTALGIRYSYAYLLGLEPRFKMRYGSYVAAGRAARILFHLSGTLGSPFGAWLPTLALGPDLHAAAIFCWALFYITLAINVVPFALGMLGIERLGHLRLSLGSAASAALEIREGR